ncbi:tol-pal system protein YbgF [Alteromonas halophila]|uniref:tol-pal system protein YbgF n=1 Tax=Alteromonas halophila TaxID=516698 RepID=UPI0016776AF4|nr:tol-pal system protein YbgF [Alteromonas halophila]
MRKRTQVAAAVATLVVSAGVLAQAPVYDVNGSSNLEQRVEVLERMVKSRTEMQHRLQEQLDTLQMEIDQLRGAVEVNTNELEKVLERQRELYLEIDKRVEALKQGGFTQSTSSSGSGNSVSQPANTGNTSSGSNLDEGEAYDNAVNLILKSREYDKAIPAFQSFLDRFPDSEYAPNAHYWLGQLLFNKQQWQEAKAQFNVVVARFTDSSKRPDALLKLGVIEARQGNSAAARSQFQKVISEYPDSSASRLAESKLNGQ